MKESTKIRLKAAGLLYLMVQFAPLFFLIAGVYEKWFAKREMRPPQGTFKYGLKIMAKTYIEAIPELWNEFKFGVQSDILER